MKIKTGCELTPWGDYFQTKGVREAPMKVKDLIEIFKTHDPAADILINVRVCKILIFFIKKRLP